MSMSNPNSEKMSVETYTYILELMALGKYDPNCETCEKYALPALMAGKKIFNIFMPPHQAKLNCESGKHPHCSCDICF